jgi:group I intron endonuclease
MSARGRSAAGETRAELKRSYKATRRQAGIYQIKNNKTGKILMGSSTNLHGPLNKHRFMLSIGRHDNAALQSDWEQLGPESFTFEILETVKPSDDPAFCVEDELTLLEQIWLEKLQPFGERGYNHGPIRRD